VIIQVQEQRQDIGLAGSGNMKFDDILNKEDNPSYDVPSDLLCHMRDDTAFYRQMYYPTMAKCQDCYNNGDKNKTIEIILPMIDKGVDHYIKKYDLPQRGNDLITMDERKSLAEMIYEQEVEAFKEGEY